MPVPIVNLYGVISCSISIALTESTDLVPKWIVCLLLFFISDMHH